MADVIQYVEVDWFPDVAHWPLRIGRSNDFVCAGGVLIGGQDANLSPGDLLLMDVHRLHKVEMSANRVFFAKQETGTCLLRHCCSA